MHVFARRVLPASSALLLLAAPAHAGIFRVGVGSGCTHATVQAAVDASAATSETDTILVARNTTYNGQAITIHNQSLNMFGGYADCNTLLHSGRTVLSGNGGAAAPVMSVTGSGNVTLWRLDLTRGDSPDDGQGGGLYFNGSGVMRLEELNVIQNQAGYGAGIHARGTSATAELIIGADVLVSNNTAERSGGGINAENIRLTMTSPGSAVFFNTAVGLEVGGEFLWGDGGGIRCHDCQARIGTASAFGTIFMNTANHRGGGLAVSASGKDVSVDLFTGVATTPVSIWGNRAGLRGGGIFARSTHESIPPAYYSAYLWAWDLALRQNTAPLGAAVHLDGDDDFTGDAQTWFSLGVGGRPAGAVACAPALRPCNRIYENEARALDGTPANGAILQGGTEATRFELVHTALHDNVGRAVLRHGTSHWTMLKNCLFTGNTVSEELIQHLDSFPILVNDTTIAGNAIGGSHVIVAGEDVRMGHSIVWQPGKRVLRRESSGGELLLRSLIVNDIADLPPQVDILAPATPGFASLVERDFRLRAGSVAVDFAQYAPEFDFYTVAADLAGGTREHDLAEVADEFGPRDVGAYELQEFPDLIFKDQFDLGGLAGWSTAATDGGDLSATAAAALVGTIGLQAAVDDTAGLYVQDDSPGDEPRYRARFYFDPNGFDPGEALGHRRTRIFIGFTEGPQRRVLAVVLRRQNGAYAVMARARLDGNTQVETPFVPISDGPHVIEVDLRAATSPAAHDGHLVLWVDGAGQSVLGLDNHEAAVDFARLGALSVKGGSWGAPRFDAFESRRRTYIGPVP